LIENSRTILGAQGRPATLNTICDMCYLLSEPHTLLIAIVVGLLRNTMVCLQKNRN